MTARLLAALLIATAANGQQKTAEKPKSSTLTCLGQTAKACSSFKQLVDSHDQDILDAVAKKPSYVCLRPGVDAFVIFELTMPSRDSWKKLGDGGEFQDAVTAVLEEYQDGTSYMYKLGIGEWKRMDEKDTPIYHALMKPKDGDQFEVNVSAAEIVATLFFKNQSNSTTHYSLVIRRSTGRFTEHYEAESGRTLDYTGTCLIYQ